MKKKSDNQSIRGLSDELVRNYEVPSQLKKEDVLNTLLTKIENNEKSKFLSTKKTRPQIYLVLSAAASIAILLSFYFFTATIQYSGEEGKNTSVRLPDNSRAIIHGKGEIRIKKYLWNRKVDLGGTAYFEVEKGGRFTIYTQTGYVEVLGTRFLVSEVENEISVACYTGKVKANVNENEYILSSGMQVSVSDKENKPVMATHSQTFPEFALFNKSYSDIGLAEVAKELETFYDVKIEVKKGNERKFSGSIQTGKLESALEIVCTSMQLQFAQKKENEFVIF